MQVGEGWVGTQGNSRDNSSVLKPMMMKGDAKETKMDRNPIKQKMKKAVLTVR